MRDACAKLLFCLYNLIFMKRRMEALLYLHVLTITILSNESFCASAFVVAFNLRTNPKIVTWVGFAHVLLYKK